MTSQTLHVLYQEPEPLEGRVFLSDFNSVRVLERKVPPLTSDHSPLPVVLSFFRSRSPSFSLPRYSSGLPSRTRHERVYLSLHVSTGRRWYPEGLEVRRGRMCTWGLGVSCREETEEESFQGKVKIVGCCRWSFVQFRKFRTGYRTSRSSSSTTSILSTSFGLGCTVGSATGSYGCCPSMCPTPYSSPEISIFNPNLYLAGTYSIH